MNASLSLIPYTKFNEKMGNNLNVKCEIIKILLGKKKRKIENCQDLELGN